MGGGSGNQRGEKLKTVKMVKNQAKKLVIGHRKINIAQQLSSVISGIS